MHAEGLRIILWRIYHLITETHILTGYKQALNLFIYWESKPDIAQSSARLCYVKLDYKLTNWLDKWISLVR